MTKAHKLPFRNKTPTNKSQRERVKQKPGQMVGLFSCMLQSLQKAVASYLQGGTIEEDRNLDIAVIAGRLNENHSEGTTLLWRD